MSEVSAGHPNVAQGSYNLGLVLMEQNKFADAEPAFRAARDMFFSAYGKDDSRVATAQASLGRALVNLGRYGEAEPLLLEAEKTYSTSPDLLANKRGQCAKFLVELYEKWDKAAPGQGHAQRAAPWRLRASTSAPATSP